MTALAVSVERPGRGKQVSGLGELNLGLGKRQGFAVVSLQGGFEVKGIDLRRSSFHKKKDYPFGSLGEARWVGLAMKHTRQSGETQPHCPGSKEASSGKGFRPSLIHRHRR